jgi:transcriptional regulator with XRE-family HTH domain
MAEERRMTPASFGNTRVLDWPRWMRGVGRQALRVREFLGLSQEELARMASVSQGAISRFENGRGLATPLLVVMKISDALHSALARLDPASLSPEARRIVEQAHHLPGPDGDYVAYPLASDGGVEEVLRVYHSVPQRHRPQFLVVLKATASALGANERAPSSSSTRA